jgi:hypothetical protein
LEIINLRGIIESYKNVIFSLFEHTNLLSILDTINKNSPNNNCFISIDYDIRIPNEGNNFFHKDRTIYTCLIFNNKEQNLVSTEWTFYCSEKDTREQEYYKKYNISNVSVEKSYKPYMDEINAAIGTNNETCKKIRFFLPMMYPIIAFFNYLLWHSTPSDSEERNFVDYYATNEDGTITIHYKKKHVEKCKDVVRIGDSTIPRESCFIALVEKLQPFIVTDTLGKEDEEDKKYIVEYERFVYSNEKEENKTNIKEETIRGSNFSEDLDAFYTKGFQPHMLFTGGKKRCKRKTKNNKKKRTRKHMKKNQENVKHTPFQSQRVSQN